MKKLKLNIDDLKVESFETNNNTEQKEGTINGFAINTKGNGDSCSLTCHDTCLTCEQHTCLNTCYETCAGASCDPTCGISCDCYTWPDPAICTD